MTPLKRIFVAPDRIDLRLRTATIASAEAHHLARVVRVLPGDTVEIFDGRGNSFHGQLEQQDETLRVVSLHPVDSVAESPLHIVLALALTRGPRFEWALQKTTELGVGEIVPLESRFCEVRIARHRLGDRLHRWRRIVQEAARQCGRSTTPRIHPPVPFEDFLASDQFGNAARLIYYEKALGPPGSLPPAAPSWVVCIGPEGGWDPEEVRSATEAGYSAARLGPRILRAETAAVVAVTLLQLYHGDLGPGSGNNPRENE